MFVLRVTYFLFFFILFFLDTCKIVVLLITMKTLAEKKKGMILADAGMCNETSVGWSYRKPMGVRTNSL